MSESIKELRRICQKPNEQQPLSFHAQVYRKISIYFTKAFLAIIAWNYSSLPRINGAKVLVVVAAGYDEKEYFDVAQALSKRGATVLTASFEKKELYGDHGGGPVIPELELTEVNVSEFDAIFIPGGKSPENMLHDSRCEILLNLVKKANNESLILSAICHGPWVLAKAGVVEGKRVVGHPETHTDLKAAGGIVTDKLVERDGNLITAQYEGLTEFKKTIVLAIAELETKS